MLAARNGCKTSQASLGALYLYGLGAERSDLKGVAWLGTAARGSEDPDILRVFEPVWEKVPEKTRPALTSVIDQYVEKYGMDPLANCRNRRNAGSHTSIRDCVFEDQ